MKFLLPQGIGDSVWAIHKLQSASKKVGDGKIEAYLNCSEENDIQTRSLDFIQRFDFIDEAKMLPGISIHPPSGWIDEQGHYVYIPDGPLQFCGETYYALMPNGHLERGNRLENWLPEFEINWDVMQHFRITEKELGCMKYLRDEIGDYAVFYLGPFAGNNQCGHNRDGMWTPQDWVDLGRRVHNELNLSIVVVGAPYDAMYYDFMIRPLVQDTGYWYSILGNTNIGELYGVTMGSRFVISYQSGVGIVSNYLGVPVGIFWRPKGNSINSEVFLSFEEEMASAWARPSTIKAGRHMPLIYGRHDVGYIMSEIHKRGW
jgi:hypothetical protein